MVTTRMQLTEYLEKRQAATVEEISRVLSVTPANVRHHLKVLLAEGVVEVVGQKPIEGRGRPVQLFGLSRQAHTHNLNHLSVAALAILFEGVLPEDRAAVLQKLAASLAQAGKKEGAHPSQKFLSAVQHLNQMHYQARWEAHTQAPRVIFSHCPYRAILADHPELCKMDALILEHMLGLKATQLARLERTAQGTTQCVFRMGALER